MLKFYKNFHIQPVSDNGGGNSGGISINYVTAFIDSNYIFTNKEVGTSRPTNYANMNKLFTVGSSNWTIKTKLNSLSSSLLNGQHHVLFGFCGNDTNKRWTLPLIWIGSQGGTNIAYLFLSSNGSSWDISNSQAGTHVYTGTEYIKLTFDGSKYVVSYSTDDETYIDDITVTSSTIIYNNTETPLSFGAYYGAEGNAINGSIDLKETKVYVADSLYWEAVTKTKPSIITGYSLIGGATDEDGIITVASGKYVTTNFDINFSAYDSWAIVSKIYIISVGQFTQAAGFMGLQNSSSTKCLNSYIANANKVRYELSFDGSSYANTLSMSSTFTNNTWFYVKCEFTGSVYNLYFGTSLDNMTLQDTLADSTKLSNKTGVYVWGKDEGASSDVVVSSKFDMNECQIYLNGELYWQGIKN